MSLALSRPVTCRAPIAVVSAVIASALVAPVVASTVDSVRAIVARSTTADPVRLDPGLNTSTRAAQAVIVQAAHGRDWLAAQAVREVGGSVGRSLPIVEGFSASVPGTNLVELAAHPAIRAITADTQVKFSAITYDSNGVASLFAKASAAPNAWKRGYHGEGVGVAVIDTGISSMNDFGGRVVFGPDLSGEGRTIDSFGHGTVMAGIIAGSGADSEGRAGGVYAGMAPKATLVSVKVAGRNGATDVSTVLQAMHWVAAYKDQFNIRVLNLSWGTNSTASPSVDPLNYAVERLWKSGIVVVVAAGNNGPGAGSITKPADDPLVITAGAYDDRGTLDGSDDQVPAWSGRGPTIHGHAKPDLVAPGRTLVSARSYGSAVEAANPDALVSPSYIKGTGTSQAAAVVSGAVALLLNARPSLTPDQVKAMLRNSAVPMSGVASTAQGAGRLNLDSTLTTASTGPAQWQTYGGSGLGSLEASRGDRHVVTDCYNDGTPDEIVGEIMVTCEPWNGASWTGASWTGASWTGASWTGASWTGASWTGASWTGASWTGASWTGGEWTGASWTGASWTGASWTGASWTGASWTGASWTGASWTGASWTGASWTGASWTGASWTGASWTSASYGDSGSGDDYLMAAFWGDEPKFFQKITGEKSAPTPGNCKWTSAPAFDDGSREMSYVSCS